MFLAILKLEARSKTTPVVPVYTKLAVRLTSTFLLSKSLSPQLSFVDQCDHVGNGEFFSFVILLQVIR